MRAREVLDERYAVVRRLGAGPRTEVHEAENLLLGKRVALKVLRAELGLDPALREAFLREAKVAARLEHPNVASVLDVGDWQGHAYLVVELLVGDSLQSQIRHPGALPVASACDLVIQVLAALEYAHAQGTVHGNVNPGNIVVVYPRPGMPWIKVSDFGIRRAFGHEPLSRSEGAYQAPETRRGDLDARADVYSAAGVLYALLAGELPPPGPLPAIADKLLLLNAAVPRELALALEQALDPEPQRRVQSAAELAARLAPFALDAAAAGAAPEALYPGSSPSIRWVDRGRPWSLAASSGGAGSGNRLARARHRSSAGPACDGPIAVRDSCVTDSLLRNPRFPESEQRHWPMRWRSLKSTFKDRPNTGAAWVLALASLGAGIACAILAAWLQ